MNGNEGGTERVNLDSLALNCMNIFLDYEGINRLQSFIQREKTENFLDCQNS